MTGTTERQYDENMALLLSVPCSVKNCHICNYNRCGCRCHDREELR